MIRHLSNTHDANNRKQCEIRVSLSTDSRTSHIGPFFADVRNVSGMLNHQMTTRVVTAATGAEFIRKLSEHADANGVNLVVVDNTLNGDYTGRGGLIGTPFSD